MAPWISAARVSAAPLAAGPDPRFEPGFAIGFLERSNKAFAQTVARAAGRVNSLNRATEGWASPRRWMPLLKGAGRGPGPGPDRACGGARRRARPGLHAFKQ